MDPIVLLTGTETATSIFETLNTSIQGVFYLLVIVGLGLIVWKFYGNKKRN